MKLADRLNSLEERERKLLLVLMGLFAAMVVLFVPIGLSLMLSSDRDRNRALSEAILAVNDNRVLIEKRAAERSRVEERYAHKAPQLAGFLAQMADQAGVDIPETQDRSMVPHGKKFDERSTQIRLRQVGMLKLANFMEKIEHSSYPVTISRLDIRSRAGKPDEYDVEMIVSAFDEKAAPKKAPTKEAGAEGAEGEAQKDEEE